MEVNQQITIKVSADKLWQILGNDFGEVQQWASRMLESRYDETLGSMGGRKVTTVEYGEANETLYVFDETRRELAYRVQGDNTPPMLSDITTGWRIEAQGDEQAVVHIQFKATLKDESMSDMIHQQFGMGLKKLFAELKYFAENDQPQPNKSGQSV